MVQVLPFKVTKKNYILKHHRKILLCNLKYYNHANATVSPTRKSNCFADLSFDVLFKALFFFINESSMLSVIQDVLEYYLELTLCLQLNGQNL